MANDWSLAAGTLVAADTKIQSSFDALVAGFNASLQELRALSMLRLEGDVDNGDLF